jgi:hypothetical protein
LTTESSNFRNHRATPSITFINSTSNSSNISTAQTDEDINSNDIDVDFNDKPVPSEDDSKKQLMLETALPKLKAIRERYPSVSPLKLMRRYKKLVADVEKAAERHMLRETADSGSGSRSIPAYTTASSFRYNKVE